MVPGYIDVDDCNNDEIVLTVPDGFSENSYVWYCGNDSASAERTHYDGLHRVHLSRTDDDIYPYYRCEVKTQAGVPIIYECRINSYKKMTAEFTYEQIQSDVANNQYTVQFINKGIYEQYSVPMSSDTLHPGFQNVEWDFGDNSPHDTAVQPVHVYNEQGFFMVKLKVWDNDFRCCDSLSGLIHVDSVNHVSILDYTSDQLRIYPNPATDVVSIVGMDDILLHEARIMDMAGRVVRTFRIEDSQTTLNIRDLPAGNYLIEVRTSQGTVSKPIVKR